ncbi:thioredoxin domain-containing protein [Macrococcus bovicus]|uniref:Uncharacterized protein n=1 Tax=Macrococcus bovicus TaxID=69968 RepID=A0A4V3BFQ0_9STAP|nr:thioredoxin domain-containing protein [Macrococcus bovicus]TDM15329.1 hypothetical protein ERX55_00015 [Macrococcus bovicus]
MTSYKGFEKVLTQKDEQAFIFIGRPSCDYCVVLKPLFYKAIQQTKFKGYELNTDSIKNKTDREKLEKLFAKLNIDSVPIIISNENPEKRYTGDSKVEKIVQFMEEKNHE